MTIQKETPIIAVMGIGTKSNTTLSAAKTNTIKTFGGFATSMPDNLPIRYSRGTKRFDNCPDQREAPDIDAFINSIYNDMGEEKGQQWISSAFSEGKHSDPTKYPGQKTWRLARLAQPRVFLCMDADGMPDMGTFQKLLNQIAPITSCLYTTSSHTEENPRARVILALNREVTDSESIVLGKAIERLLEDLGIEGVRWDESVYRLSQPCYLPIKGAIGKVFLGGFAINVDTLLKSHFAVDSDNKSNHGASTESFVELSFEKQQGVIAEIQLGLNELWTSIHSQGFDSLEKEQLLAQLATLGGSLCWCWQFDDSSLDTVISELTSGDVNDLNRNQWLSRVVLGARMAPVGSEHAENIKAALRKWSEQHKCYKGYLPVGNEQCEFEANGGLDDPFRDFQERWSEGERTTRTDNSPFNRFQSMRSRGVIIPKLILAEGAPVDLFARGFSNEILMIGSASRTNIVVSKESRADVYNGEIYASLARGRLIFIPEHKQWRRWTGTTWDACTRGEEVAHAKEVCKHLSREAANLHTTDTDRAAKEMKHAAASQTANKIEAMVKLAKSEPGTSVNASQLDADPMLLGVRNGVIDLKTGRLLAADPSMYITKSCNASYDRSAHCPQWLKFLADIFPNDPDTIETIQRSLGYTLTGLNTEEKLFICVGHGSNGKSVFGNIVHSLLGDYAQAAAGSLLVARQKGDTGARDDLASLAGCRYVGINETQSGDRLDEQVVKMIAGRELITARFMYGSNVSYMPQFTPWLRTNHRPIITGTDEGVWRRLAIINFTQQFSDEQKDPYLEQKLMAEQDGILAWMLEGTHKYLHEGGLKLSANIIKASAAYRDESDILGEFLQTETKDDPNEQSESRFIWNRYVSWCNEGGYKYGTQRSLTRKLAERGYPIQKSNSKSYYKGIKLNS